MLEAESLTVDTPKQDTQVEQTTDRAAAKKVEGATKKMRGLREDERRGAGEDPDEAARRRRGRSVGRRQKRRGAKQEKAMLEAKRLDEEVAEADLLEAEATTVEATRQKTQKEAQQSSDQEGVASEDELLLQEAIEEAKLELEIEEDVDVSDDERFWPLVKELWVRK